MNTAQRILKVVKTLPESALFEVLDFAEYLEIKYKKQVTQEESLMQIFDSLPNLPSFKGDPLLIQKKLRDEWR
jgi:hypothetical protein